MSSPPTAVAEHSTGAPLVPGVKPKPSDVVWQAHEVLAEDGILLSLNKVHKMLRRMWADEAAAERKRDRLIDYQGSLRKGADRRFSEDPVGEVAAELVDFIRGWKVER